MQREVRGIAHPAGYVLPAFAPIEYDRPVTRSQEAVGFVPRKIDQVNSEEPHRRMDQIVRVEALVLDDVSRQDSRNRDRNSVRVGQAEEIYRGLPVIVKQIDQV